MARNGAGVYSKVNTFSSGATITASGHNANWDDLVTEMTNSVAADGQTTMTGPLKAANGTAAAPAYTFGSDTNTGLYHHGSDELGFATAGTLAAYFDASQKLFLSGAVDVAGATTVAALTASGIIGSTSTSHQLLASGTTAQRPGTPAAGQIRYNSTLAVFEGYSGTSWVSFVQPAITPQGRLTLTSGVPVLASDATAQSTIYYTPYAGNLIPIYDGTAFVLSSFSEISMVMSGTNFAANAIYDLFVVNDAGTIRLGIGPAWTTATAGSGARGTGAGTTELQLLNGIWTNKVSITLRYAAASTVSIAANKATYVGSVAMDGTNSQASCHLSYGQSRKRAVWNAYNRVPIVLKVGDSTATWTYNSTTIRQSNAAAGNTGAIFVGLQEEVADIVFDQSLATANGGATAGACYIGYNSTTAATGIQGFTNYNSTLPTGTAKYTTMPVIGLNNINMLESAPVGTPTFNGTESSSLMTIRYRA